MVGEIRVYYAVLKELDEFKLLRSQQSLTATTTAKAATKAAVSRLSQPTLGAGTFSFPACVSFTEQIRTRGEEICRDENYGKLSQPSAKIPRPTILSVNGWRGAREGVHPASRETLVHTSTATYSTHLKP